MSDDGRFGLTLILLVGSVFSPHYRRSIARGEGDPLRHSAVNLALYDMQRPGGSWLWPALRGEGRDRWVLTEGGRVERDRSALSIGPSTARWEGGALRAEIREVTAPFASPLEGELTVEPVARTSEVHALDEAGKHLWSPIAPLCRVTACFRQPAVRFCGDGYLDHNRGDELLGHGFREWTWSRMSSATETAVVYDVTRKDGSTRRLSRLYHEGGGRPAPGPEAAATALGDTLFRMKRAARSADGSSMRLGRTLEDAPFYARSHVVGSLHGAPADGVHEVVDLGRFESPLVQRMLPYRMRRRSA